MSLYIGYIHLESTYIIHLKILNILNHPSFCVHTPLRFLAAMFCFKGLCRPPTGQIDIVHQVEVGQVVLAGAGGSFLVVEMTLPICFGEKILTLK